MSTGLENVIRSMFAAVDVSPVWFRIVIGGGLESDLTLSRRKKVKRL